MTPLSWALLGFCLGGLPMGLAWWWQRIELDYARAMCDIERAYAQRVRALFDEQAERHDQERRLLRATYAERPLDLDAARALSIASGTSVSAAPALAAMVGVLLLVSAAQVRR
ncbi:hypothetical protein L6R53_14075 [Myxococcota bacterium]|nr:hypothetical protein [Myxococcota bacterium]